MLLDKRDECLLLPGLRLGPVLKKDRRQTRMKMKEKCDARRARRRNEGRLALRLSRGVLWGPAG